MSPDSPRCGATLFSHACATIAFAALVSRDSLCLPSFLAPIGCPLQRHRLSFARLRGPFTCARQLTIPIVPQHKDQSAPTIHDSLLHLNTHRTPPSFTRFRPGKPHSALRACLYCSPATQGSCPLRVPHHSVFLPLLQTQHQSPAVPSSPHFLLPTSLLTSFHPRLSWLN